MTATILRGDARALPLADASVDLIVTSPPYWALRSYTDGGEHYDGQIGAEPTPAAYIDSLIDCTREWMRVLKPTGSIWVNLGDSYSGKPSSDGTARRDRAGSRGTHPHRRPGSRQFTREDAAWLAGVIDSDGSVSIRINKQPKGNAPSFVPWIRIGQMRPEVVHRAAELTGVGRIMEDGRGVWNWCASSQQARWVLERIHPWLLIKRRQAFAAIELARHVEDRNGRGEYRPLTADDITYRHRLRDAAMAWNAGTEYDFDVPEAAAVPLPIYPVPQPEKSLRDLPHWYVQECVGRLGLIKRAEICWSKPNGLPESVTDRVRRSHEFWFHLTKSPRYFSAVDTIREAHAAATLDRNRYDRADKYTTPAAGPGMRTINRAGPADPLGKLPGSVWEIATQPLRVPAEVGVDHFAAFPMAWPRRIIQGWSPSGICTACGEGRRPVVAKEQILDHVQRRTRPGFIDIAEPNGNQRGVNATVNAKTSVSATITGEACICPDTSAPTRPAVVVDPFGGTGTTALVANVLGRHGVSVDMSADYCRLARWRVTDPGQRAAALEVEKPRRELDGQDDLLSLLGEVV